jgi:hypothetical protein
MLHNRRSHTHDSYSWMVTETLDECCTPTTACVTSALQAHAIVIPNDTMHDNSGAKHHSRTCCLDGGSGSADPAGKEQPHHAQPSYMLVHAAEPAAAIRQR